MGLDLSDEPADDGLTIRSANPWALDKLDIVSCYVAGFVNACKRAGFSQVVDGFAGPGVNRIEDRLAWGTPMRVLQAHPPVDRLLAMDLDANNVRALRDRTASDTRARVVRGDVNTDLIAAMDEHLVRTAPTLAILDPEGTELDFETIRSLSRWRRGRFPVEILVLLATDTGFTRMLTRTGDGFDYAPDKMNRLFGTTDWEPIWRERQAAGDAPDAPARALSKYVQLYGQQLRDTGYTKVLDREIRRSGRQGRRGYSLIFASGHDVGERIMDHCFDTVFTSSQQLELFKSPRQSQLRR